MAKKKRSAPDPRRLTTPIGRLAKEEHDQREGHRNTKKRLRKGQTPRAGERGKSMDELLGAVQPLTQKEDL